MSEEVAQEAAPEEVPAETPENEVVDPPAEGDTVVDGDAEPAAEGDVVPEGEGAPDGEVPAEEIDEVIKMVKELNIKVDGKDILKELPFEVSPEQAEYLTKQLQLAEMSQNRAQEAADLRKKDMQRSGELEEFLNTLKSNPEAILNQMGIDVNDFAEGIMNKEVEKMQMTDEERKILELEEKLREVREAEEKTKKAAEEKEQEDLRNKYAAEYEKNLMEAIDEHGLPNSPYIMGKMVNLVATAQQNGLDLDFKDVAGMVKEEHQADLNARISGLSADDLISMLSDEARKDIVAKSIPKKDKKVAPPTADQVVETTKDLDLKDKKKFRQGRAEDFFKSL